jgi:sugar lactone lactonase YvrE
LPEVRVGEVPARIVFASSRALSVLVPSGLEAGRVAVRIAGAPGATAFIDVGAPMATGLHQVDSPVFDRAGNLYVTYSGTRDEQASVSIFRVQRDGGREPFASGIANPTSMAFDDTGHLYVSSRFEGTIYRVAPDGRTEVAAADLGVASGLAFGADGMLFVGDRSGTIFRLSPSGHTTVYASLPPSVAAYHLAMGPDQCLYVAAPTLSSADSIYRIDPRGKVAVLRTGFGRPQGLTFDALGALYVVEALAGASGLYRLHPDETAEYVLAAPALVGVAFDPAGGLVVVSNDTAYRLDVQTRGR